MYRCWPQNIRWSPRAGSGSKSAHCGAGRGTAIGPRSSGGISIRRRSKARLIVGSRISDDCSKPCNVAARCSMAMVLAAASLSRAAASFVSRSCCTAFCRCSARFAAWSAARCSARCAAVHSLHEPDDPNDVPSHTRSRSVTAASVNVTCRIKDSKDASSRHL